MNEIKEWKRVFSIAFLTLVPFAIQASAAAPAEQAAACMEAHDFTGAIVWGKKWLASASTKQAKIESLLFLAHAASLNHDYATAIQSLDQVISLLDRSNVAALNNMIWKRGKAYSGAGNYARAVADYNKVAAYFTNPRDQVNFLRDRAAAYEKLGEYEKSIADLTKALTFVDRLLGPKAAMNRISRMKGDKTTLLYLRSKLLEKVGRIDEAKRDKAEADRLSEDW